MGRDRQLVIIGNGGAGLSALKAIRSINRSEPVTLVSTEDCLAYSPVALTYYLAGRINRDQLFITNDAFYRKYRVKTLLGRKAIEIYPERSQLRTGGNKLVPYDKVLIATGASPVLPAAYRNGGVLALRTLEDADRIIASVRSPGSVVILGGGLVSLQVAQALWMRGMKITVVVKSNQILSKNVDSEAASMVQKALQKKDVTICLGADALSFERDEGVTHVHLSTGEVVTACMVISGKGVSPNFLQGFFSGDQDFMVDERMRTRVENVYAAGDVCLVKHLISGKWERVPNWPNSCYQGWVAGRNMAGVDAHLDSIVNHNVTQLFGIQVASIGLYDPTSDGDYEVLRWSDKTRHVYKRIVLTDGRILGAILVNEIEDAGRILNLINRKASFSGRLLSKNLWS